MAPDGPHGEELASLVLLILDDQRGASAHKAVIPWKGSFSQILILAVLFVFSVLALYKVVAEELLLQADILTGPPPASCSAHQVFPTISTSSPPDLAVLASIVFIHHMSALAGCGTCASAIDYIVAGLVQRPKNLGSREALLPGKFLRVRKVFARITKKTF